ncbi:MAG: uroporphyrinogen decarboxylase family protein [Armatimonadota bacterium]|nr:uroporphyrinogen decarboxylase family protein [Armatimonadota bacterium]
MNLRRQPDFEQFLKALWRSGKPDHLPFYEHYASPEFIAARTGTQIDKMGYDSPGFWDIYVDFWLGMGFDCVPMEIPLNCPRAEGHHAASEGSEAFAVIRTWEDYEKYPWPDESHPLEFKHYETVAELLPDGAKIVAGVCMGPYEWTSQMMGVMGLSYALIDSPGLAEAVFGKISSLIISADRQIATMDAVGALRQGDDLGFKTSTFLPPGFIREHILPTYKKCAEIAHDSGKPYILHSCGNLMEIYEDLIEECKIDAKHSFEDGILPVIEFKKQYGKRITALGGLDVDVICRSSGDYLRAYTRKHIEKCYTSSDGFWALGTGNSLTDYMPVENYLIVLEEGINITRA